MVYWCKFFFFLFFVVVVGVYVFFWCWGLLFVLYPSVQHIFIKYDLVMSVGLMCTCSGIIPRYLGTGIFSSNASMTSLKISYKFFEQVFNFF